MYFIKHISSQHTEGKVKSVGFSEKKQCLERKIFGSCSNIYPFSQLNETLSF